MTEPKEPTAKQWKRRALQEAREAIVWALEQQG